MSQLISSIIQQCSKLESAAIRIYSRFAELFPSEEIKIFWLEMADQEKAHVVYWREVQTLVEQGKLDHIFEHPIVLQNELKVIEKSIASFEEKIDSVADIEEAILIAYRLEFIILHPALEAVFFMLKKETGDASPEDTYASHIRGLIQMLQKLGRVKPEFKLISDLMARVWESNQVLARRMADIHELRRLVPICMHCKNVRDDEGYWEQVETYVGDKIDISFSHGICPDCLKKYYDELSD